jgi:hypothetical protein
MLPGFRFLFAAIVLSMSLLIFGLGAAALLRAAHEEFASTPTWRAAPETVFAQPAEATRPVLALLRVDAPVPDKASEKVPDSAPADAASAATSSAPAEPERIAALKPEDSPSPESAKPENPVAETAVAETTAADTTAAESPAQNEAAPPPVDAPVPVAETRVVEAKNVEIQIADTKIATSEEAPLPANQAEPMAASEPTGARVSPQAGIAATKIATLGGPAVTIKTPRPVKAESTKPDPNVIKKRQQAKRAAQRRELAARARVTVQLPPQQVDPFGQPAPTIVRRR